MANSYRCRPCTDGILCVDCCWRSAGRNLRSEEGCRPVGTKADSVFRATVPAVALPVVDHIDHRARELLERDPELAAVVADAVEQLRGAFEGARIDLTYFTDHEDSALVEHVIVTAFPRLSSAQAHETMRRVDDAWLLDNMNRAGGRFGVEVHPLG